MKKTIIKDNIYKKREFLDYLFYNIGKQKYDFYLQFSQKDGKMTKWKRYSEVCFDYENGKNKWFIEHCNQRQILPIEIVLDLEERNSIYNIVKELESFNVIFYIYETGSRGYHIHIFFKRELTQKEKIYIIEYFGSDIQKAYDKTLIALENSKHWKSNKIKRRIFPNEL